MAIGQLDPAQLTVAKLLDLGAECYGNNELVRAPGCRASYRELRDRVAGWGGSLRAAGILHGDRVAIMAPNSPEMLELILACAWVGAIPVTVNTALRGRQLEHVLENSKPALFLGDSESTAALPTPSQIPSLRRIWVMAGDTAGLDADDLPLGPAPGPTEIAAPHPSTPGDPAVIIYTSGTTGVSKGVICPHAQFFWWGVNTAWNLGVTSKDVLYTCLPLFHTNALSAFFQALLFGSTLTLGPRFSASRFWQQTAESGATVTYLLGAMVKILLEQEPTPTDAKHNVRIALSPATPPGTNEEFKRRFGVTLLEAYGSTETNHVIGAEPGALREGSMGTILPGFRAKVVDERDNSVPDGSVGELLLRPEEPFSFASGYHAMPDSTIEAWRNFWFHTGDRVIREADGSFRFFDRIKDALRRRGENISSQEVEAAILMYPGVAAAAVFGVPSDLGEDEVMAALVLKDETGFDPLELMCFLEQQLAYFAIPRFVELCEELPLTENGKVRKAVLRERGVRPQTWDAEEAGYRPPRPGEPSSVVPTER